MILQLGGLGNITGGIKTTVTTVDKFHDPQSLKGKFKFW